MGYRGRCLLVAAYQRGIFNVESGLLEHDNAGIMFKCIPGSSKEDFERRKVVENSGNRKGIISVENSSPI